MLAIFLYQRTRGSDEGKKRIVPAILVDVREELGRVGHFVLRHLVGRIAEVVAGDESAEPRTVNGAHGLVIPGACPGSAGDVFKTEYGDIRYVLRRGH